MMLFTPTIYPGDVIAVGDIHGRFDLLDELCTHVTGTGARVIFLGDMIDRGPNSIGVVERIHDMVLDPEAWGLEEVIALMGNHEWMLMDALTGPMGCILQWLRNGGTQEQYDALEPYYDWMKNLPVFVTINDTMFIHAGVYPGHDPREAIFARRTDRLLWMREPFLTLGPQFEKWNPNLKRIVFGHTPETAMPYLIPNGICIDTAAWHTGILTTYNATQNTFWNYDLDVEPPVDH